MKKGSFTVQPFPILAEEVSRSSVGGAAAWSSWYKGWHTFRSLDKMTWQDLDDEIEKWIKTSNVALKILFPSKQCLYGRTFFGFAFVFFNLLWSDHSVVF
ncbi:hypothetical protein LR48_Vigan04g048200 [Vigna angularis]|uniref:Uncharacterized protein n=1 Tax=Phaseolus angularis TaxID=3914 RepID=A0A0L9UCM6_PHAAN|nr:hypothetical protein LR48_Vigan04g048200 [Vigna angularis]